MSAHVPDTTPAKPACDPCSIDRQQREAEGFCEDCQHFLCKECCAYHRKPIPSRHHNVIYDVRSSPPRTRDNGSRSPGNLVIGETCDKHRPEAIKFHCESHDFLGCGTCMMLNHRDCRTVYIPAVMEGLDVEKERENFEVELANLEIELEDTLNQADGNILEAKRLYGEMKNAFSTFKERVLDQLKVMEKEFEEKANAIKAKDVKAMETIITKCKQDRQRVDALKKKTNLVTGRKDGVGFFIHTKRSGKELSALRNSLDTIKSELWVQRYEFVPAVDFGVQGALGNLAVFESESDVDESDDDSTGSEAPEEEGKGVEDPLSPYLSVPELDKLSVHDNHEELQTGDRAKMTLTFRGDLVTKASADFEHVEVTGLVLLPDNKLVIVDKGNQNVKLINTRKNKVVSEIKVRYMIYNMWEPFGVTAVDGNQVAVTCPFRQRIQFLKVKKSLSEGSVFKVSGRCYGIAYSAAQRVFFVTFSEPAKIEMIDRSGNTLRALVTVSDAHHLFQQPSYALLTRDGKNLFISDCGKSTVTQFNFANDVTSVAVYKPDSPFDPLGMTSDRKGRVLVCDMSHDNIHCLSEGLASKHTLIDGENRFPSCITYSEDEDSYYMATGLDKVVIFQLK